MVNIFFGDQKVLNEQQRKINNNKKRPVYKCKDFVIANPDLKKAVRYMLRKDKTRS
jgi:hypothetical protein